MSARTGRKTTIARSQAYKARACSQWGSAPVCGCACAQVYAWLEAGAIEPTRESPAPDVAPNCVLCILTTEYERRACPGARKARGQPRAPMLAWLGTRARVVAHACGSWAETAGKEELLDIQRNSSRQSSHGREN
eukprot:6174352-Pleurochrysis_carterae.AAC.4